MNVHLWDRWIGRGTANDKHIPWPSRSPDLTPMDYFPWGYIKNQAYVRNYENLDDLKALVTAAFQEVSREILSSTMANFGKRLKKVIKPLRDDSALRALSSSLAWPSGEGHGLAFVWRKFNPSPTQSCITEAKAYRLKQFQ